jgi:hypothetical protein
MPAVDLANSETLERSLFSPSPSSLLLLPPSGPPAADIRNGLGDGDERGATLVGQDEQNGS